MKKIILFISLSLITTLSFSQGGITPINQWFTSGNTFSGSTNWLGTKNAQNLVLKTNNSTVATFSTNGGATLGTGTVAANTSSMGIVRIKQGSSWIDFGEGSSAGSAKIWMGVTSPANTDYHILGTSSVVRVNGSNGGSLQQGASNIFSWNTSGATLTGTMSVSGQTKQTNTLNLEGNTTWNTNQTNTLTTGNSGTVAVLSDVWFPFTFMSTTHSPADASTYYFGNMPYPSQTQSFSSIYVPSNLTLVSWNLNSAQNATATAETSTLQVYINNIATNLSTTISNTLTVQSFSASGLSIDVPANSKVECRILTPTWVTNPTTESVGITLWFVRRQ